MAQLIEEITWAAIDAVCPGAGEERRRIDSGEQVPVVAGDFSWSSARRVVWDQTHTPA